jgi:DNA-binding sugar fermentation-stimulating protein
MENTRWSRGEAEAKASLLQKSPVLYPKRGIFEKNQALDEKKYDFMIAEIKQICIFVAVKNVPVEQACFAGN